MPELDDTAAARQSALGPIQDAVRLYLVARGVEPDEAQVNAASNLVMTGLTPDKLASIGRLGKPREVTGTAGNAG